MTASDSDRINELIDRLVAEGRATRQRGNIVVWVTDWWSLTDEEQAMIRTARELGIRSRPAPAAPPKPMTQAQREAVDRRAAARRKAAAAQREAAEKKAELARVNRERRKEERKYGHLTAPTIPPGMERWQKAAWWAAASERRKPSYAWARLSVVAGWLVDYLDEYKVQFHEPLGEPYHFAFDDLQPLREECRCHSRPGIGPHRRGRHLPVSL